MKSFSVILLLSGITFILSNCSAKQEEGVTIRKTKLGTIRTVIKNTWTPKSKAIINKDSGGWEFKELAEGESIVINLNRWSKLVESFDGVGYYTIAIQLPKNVAIGKTYKLKPVAKNRNSKKINDWDELGDLKDGEIVAFEYSNPEMGWLTLINKASVRIIALNEKQAIVHLLLDGKGQYLESNDLDWDFNFDEQFTLNIDTKKITPKIAIE